MGNITTPNLQHTSSNHAKIWGHVLMATSVDHLADDIAAYHWNDACKLQHN
jgi:hypothetical protein